MRIQPTPKSERATVRLRVVLPSDFPVAERPCLPCFQPKRSARFSPPHSESPGGHTDGSLVWITSGLFWSSDRQKSTRNFMINLINLTIDRWKLIDGLTFDRWIHLTNLTIDTHAVPSGIHASQGQLLSCYGHLSQLHVSWGCVSRPSWDEPPLPVME